MAAVALCLMVAAPAAFAQDPLEKIAQKTKIDRLDQARIQTEVSERAKKLADAGTDANQRLQARERLLSTYRLKTASKDFKDFYAECCAKGLELLATSEVFETGFDAVMVLSELGSVKTAETLAEALKSVHAATRLRAARGLQALQKQLVADPKAAKIPLRALGEAGEPFREQLWQRHRPGRSAGPDADRAV